MIPLDVKTKKNNIRLTKTNKVDSSMVVKIEVRGDRDNETTGIIDIKDKGVEVMITKEEIINREKGKVNNKINKEVEGKISRVRISREDPSIKKT